jgi:hypothetical protein
VVGGGNVAAQFADEERLDEVRVTVVPVVLGEGKPLFECHLPAGALRLTRVLPRDNGMVELRYEIRLADGGGCQGAALRSMSEPPTALASCPAGAREQERRYERECDQPDGDPECAAERVDERRGRGRALLLSQRRHLLDSTFRRCHETFPAREYDRATPGGLHPRCHRSLVVDGPGPAGLTRRACQLYARDGADGQRGQSAERDEHQPWLADERER